MSGSVPGSVFALGIRILSSIRIRIRIRIIMYLY